MIERAELKLRMDAAVIQSGRLAEKSKAMSKEEALHVIRYGADKIFKADGDALTDEDIDAILSRGKDLTDERTKLLDKDKKQLLDFSNADYAYQQFDGVDYSALRGQQTDLEFMTSVVDAMGKRERPTYAEREPRPSAQQPAVQKLPRMKKMPDMKDYQLFQTQRIQALFVKEHEAELSRARRQARGEEDAPAEQQPLLTAEEEEERRVLLAEGFPSWTRTDFNRFIRAAERHGRHDVEKIAPEVEGKTVEEVRAYRDALFKRGPLLLQDWDRVEKKIQEGTRGAPPAPWPEACSPTHARFLTPLTLRLAGERKLAAREEMQESLRHKIGSYDNPWTQLTLKYGTSRGKVFNEEEDRFLLCMTNKLGYGQVRTQCPARHLRVRSPLSPSRASGMSSNARSAVTPSSDSTGSSSHARPRSCPAGWTCSSASSSTRLRTPKRAAAARRQSGRQRHRAPCRRR